MGYRAYRATASTAASSAAALALVLALATASAHAQISLASAVDLAVRNNPRIKSAQADVARAEAQLAETHDVYVPSLNAGAGLGQAYGYSPYPPTLFTLNSGSLIYNPSQRDYIRSARAGVDAARHNYDEVRDAVSEDTAHAFLDVQHSRERLAAILQQSTYAASLVSIVQARLDAGQASPIDLTQAKLTAANIHLALLHAQDDLAADRDHLARLLGLPADTVTVDTAFPAAPELDPNALPETEPVSPGVASAFANALARQEQATGDAKFRFRPQINLAIQYNRYATFTNAWTNIQNEYKNNNCAGAQTCHSFGADEYVFGVQINVPLYDRYRQAKARETAADASRTLHDAENAKLTSLDAQARLRHSLPEIEARAEVATLEQQLAQQRLDVLEIQLRNGNPNGPQMTPADEQNQRIAERDKALQLIDANYQLHTAQIQLLRLTGRLNAWLKAALSAPSTTTTPAPATTPSALPPPAAGAQSAPQLPAATAPQ